MAPEPAESAWLTPEDRLSIAELAELSGLTEAELRELVDYGVIAPVDIASAQWAFQATCLVTARTACRLRTGFDLEPHGVALALSLLERVAELEEQLCELRALTPRHDR